jgi:hypothetical protein
MLGENSAYFRSCAVSIVCRGLYNDSHASRRVTFIRYFGELFAIFAFARAAFDGTLDIVTRHALGASRQNGAAQTRIFAARVISLDNLLKILPRLTSIAPLKRLTFDHLLCPAIGAELF